MGELRQRGRIWWIRYYRGGVRHEESSGSSKKGVALALLQTREGDIAKGLPVTSRQARVTFRHAAQDVVNDYRTNSKRSLPDVERRLTLHLLPAFGSVKLSHLTTDTIRAYVADRQEAGAANASINRELAIIKRAFTLARQTGAVLVKPHIPMLAEHNVRAGFFEREQVDAVIAQLPPALGAVARFGYLSGWRLREILTLEWRQVDRRAQVIRLDPGQTKNKRGRLLPYGQLPELVTLLEEQWQAHGRLAQEGTLCPLVFHRKGKAIRRLEKAWHVACTAAGCPGRLFHDLRRSAVRNLVRAGVPERQAMTLTGHLTRSVFDRYDIISEADLSTAVSKLSTLGRHGRRAGP